MSEKTTIAALRAEIVRRRAAEAQAHAETARVVGTLATVYARLARWLATPDDPDTLELVRLATLLETALETAVPPTCSKEFHS